MSTEAVCFLFGIPALGYCILTFKKGWIAGRWGRKVQRDEDPVAYWFSWVFTSAVALGLIIMPILSWLGLRE